MTDRTRTPPTGAARREWHETRRRTAIVDRGIAWVEDVLYVVIALLLTLASVALVVVVARKVPSLFGDDGQNAVLDVLDVVLLIFIVVELLFAVRATVVRRELVAEPFLLVGIIASIKEIVVLSVKAAEAAGTGDAFTDRLTEIGVLGVLVLLLAVAAFLLRRKEREPDEGQDAGPEAGPEAGSDQ